MAFNLVVLTGRLTAAPELKVTTTGKNVCSFSIAVDRGFGDNKQADFINIVAWNKSAEFVSKHFKKGDMIGIEGSIQTRKYTDKNGNNRTIFEVIANNVQFVGGNNTQKTNVNVERPQEEEFAEMGEIDGDLPF